MGQRTHIDHNGPVTVNHSPFNNISEEKGWGIIQPRDFGFISHSIP